MSWGQRGRAGPHVFGCHVVNRATTAAAGARSVAPLLPAGLHLLVDVGAEVEETLLGCGGVRRLGKEQRREDRWRREKEEKNKGLEEIEME